MSNEEFILVQRQKNRRKKFVQVAKDNLSLIDFNEYEIDKDSIKGKVIDALRELKHSEFVTKALHYISNALKIVNTNRIFEIICYGLGRFSQYKASEYQLAFVMILKRNYKCQVSIYDPAFLPKEIEILKEFHIKLIESNEECKRTISNNVTLIYMPHCPRQLINNFLYSNWSRNLCNCILLTNSFSDIVKQSTKWHLMTFANYIARIYPYMTEMKLENDFEHIEVFYATSVHIFSKKRLKRISADFWLDKENPHYPSKYIEFVPADEKK